MKSLLRHSIPLIAATAAATDLRAATIPFIETFDSYTAGNNVPTGFSEGSTSGANNANITITGEGADKGYAFAIAGNQSVYSGIQVTNAVGNTFTLTTQFTLTSLTATGSAMNTGVVAFASGFNLGSNGYRIGYNLAGGTGGTGTFYLSENGTTGNLAADPGLGGGVLSSETIYSSGTITPTLGATYTLSLTAFYEAGVLNMSASLSNGATTLTVGATDSTPQSGEYFGMRLASNNGGNSATVTYDNFSIVPEPSAALLAFAGSALLLRRRR